MTQIRTISLPGRLAGRDLVCPPRTGRASERVVGSGTSDLSHPSDISRILQAAWDVDCAPDWE
jgi:hypothetical protein